MLSFLTSWEFATGAIAGAAAGVLFTRKNKDGVNAVWYVIKFYWRNITNLIRTMREKKTDGNL